MYSNSSCAAGIHSSARAACLILSCKTKSTASLLSFASVSRSDAQVSISPASHARRLSIATSVDAPDCSEINLSRSWRASSKESEIATSVMRSISSKSSSSPSTGNGCDSLPGPVMMGGRVTSVVLPVQAARNTDISAIARHRGKFDAARVPRCGLARPGDVARETLRRG